MKDIKKTSSKGVTMNKKILSLALSCLFIPQFSYAIADTLGGRIDAMGGAGVATAKLAEAGFYNPALLALETDEPFVVLLPTLGIEEQDKDHFIDKLEQIGTSYRAYQQNTLTQGVFLNQLSQLKDKTAYKSGGIGAAVGYYQKGKGANLFIKAYSDFITVSDGVNTDIQAISNGAAPARLSAIGRVLSFGIIDLGLSLAKDFSLYNQSIAFGITPKLQRIYTYHYEMYLNDFRFDDWDLDNNQTHKTSVNLDLGLVWHQGPYRLALAVTDVISRKIATVAQTYEYKITPLARFGAAYQHQNMTLTADIDLNKQSRFAGLNGQVINDDIQYVRFGGEIKLQELVDIRAGYKVNMKDSFADAFTLGAGFSPFNLFTLNLSGAYSGKNQFGLGMQFIFTY